MSTHEIVWQVPESLYRELVQTQEELAYPSVTDIISQAVQRRLAELRHEAWQQEFRQLQKQVRAAGGFGLGETKDEVIAHLREIRRQILADEYAHLY
jgi:hypothetical protein